MSSSSSSIRLLTYSSYSLPQKFSKFHTHLKYFSTAQPSSKLWSIYTRKEASKNVIASSAETNSSISHAKHGESPLSDIYSGRKKLLKLLTRRVWKHVVRKGDEVIDATCGNGHDTLALLRLIADESCKGRVYGMDLQKGALESTSSLLDRSVSPDERELVELYTICHTKMEEIVPRRVAVRLVAFNLGYLPGGDKNVKTESETTLIALEAAKRLVAAGGLISMLVYLGHSDGREEFESVQSFASGLPFEEWICCKLQMINRPLAPVLVLLSRKK